MLPNIKRDPYSLISAAVQSMQIVPTLGRALLLCCYQASNIAAICRSISIYGIIL